MAKSCKAAIFELIIQRLRAVLRLVAVVVVVDMVVGEAVDTTPAMEEAVVAMEEEVVAMEAEILDMVEEEAERGLATRSKRAVVNLVTPADSLTREELQPHPAGMVEDAMEGTVVVGMAVEEGEVVMIAQEAEEATTAEEGVVDTQVFF